MEYDVNSRLISCPDTFQLEQSIERLLQHSKNKSKFKKEPFIGSTGGRDTSNYTGKSIKRSNFAQTHFYETQFINSAAAGSHFTHCEFDNCKFINANFQECTFLHNIIKNNTSENSITNCNFNNSLFSDNFLITDVQFQHSVFQDTAFINGTIQDTTFYSSTLEDTIFSNILMNSVRFNDLNIDYSVFDNVQMSDVILPFSQICFTFGLLPYLLNTKDNVHVTSVQNKNGYISTQEFLDLLPCFEIYYCGTSDFFPLTNIYLALGEYKKAQTAILNGILLATTNCDFRQIKYLSKLIYTYSIFDFHERKQIYDYINSHISFYDMNPSLLYSYSVYKNQITSFLLNNNRTGIITSEIDILTNVYPEESEKLGILLATLEQIIEQEKSGKGEHEILCRHNSAEEIVITIQDIYQALQFIIPTIYSVLLGAFILEEKWTNHKKQKIELQNSSELKELELEEARIEVERKRIALEKEKAEYHMWEQEQITQKNSIKNEILRKNIANNNIEITEISHITYGDIPPEVDKRMLQYSYKKNT